MIGRLLRAPLTRLLIVALVPAVVLGVFVAALAAADSGDARVPAALVNDDELVQQRNGDGSTTPIAAGRLVVSGLTAPADPDSGASIDWTLTNAAEARDLLAAGDVYAIVTIPRGFSRSISTVSTEEPEQAEIRVTTDDVHGTIVSQIGGIVGDTIAQTVGGQITTQVVSGLYGGTATLRTSLLDAADGATGLGDGASSLADGLVEAAAGGDDLATGAGGIGDGARQLSSGAGALGDGARQLSDGAGSLASGLGTAASGARDAADGAESLADGVDTYTDGVAGYTGGVTAVIDGVEPILDGAASAAGGADLAASASALADELRTTAGDPELPPKTAGTLLALAAKLDGVAASGSQLGEVAGGLAEAGRALDRLRHAGTRLSSGGETLDAGASGLADGLAALPGGIRSAARGADRLADGAAGLGTGADGIASGAADLGTGADGIAAGVSDLSDGVRRSAGGADELAAGANELGSGLADGADQVPNLTDAQRERAGEVVADPVSASATRENELSGPGQIVSTLIVPVGLWVGAAALVLLFGAVSRRLLATGVGTGRLVGGALARGAVVAVGQATLIVLLVAATLGVPGAALPLLFLVALVAGTAFLAIHQLLQTVFGRAGTVLSIVLLGVQLVAVGGIYPIELVSAPFQTLSPLLPLTAAVQATTAVLAGGAGALIGTGILSLLLWALLAFVLTVTVVARRRTSPAMFAATPALP